MSARRAGYERDAAAFPADAYIVDGWRGISWRVLGWETEPDEDTDWTGLEVRTGSVLAVMVGDDFRHRIDPRDLTPLGEDDYCHVCGQVGCRHDGRERAS